MKKTGMVILICLLAVPGMISAQESRDSLKLVYYDAYFPFSWKENGEMKGILIDIINEALGNRAGIRISHEGYPWIRAQKMVKTGKADAFVTGPTAERRKYTEASKIPAIMSKDVIFVKAGHPEFEALKKTRAVTDLKRYLIATYRGNGWAEETLKGMKVDWLPDQETVFNVMMRRDNLDITIESSILGHAILKKMSLAGKIVEVPDVVLVSYPYHLCVGKNSSYVGILPEFDKTIERMGKDGTLGDILSRYK